ncbi:MAG: glycosyltransferase [Bacteroides sp.]|nr:glycosyltransferase [Bacteroides sp.]
MSELVKKIDPNIQQQINWIAEKCEKIKPLVAINCITYNHEKYLRDALEGFVMQKTDFPVVALVHDDASTDGTAAILREYAEKYPDLIFPIYEEENQYSKGEGTVRHVMQAARNATGAKYIAYCEGDDYWTDPLKLQKQVDYLEAHPDCSLCFHNTVMHWEDGREPDKVMFDIDENVKYTGRDILENCPMQTASIVVRHEILKSDLYIEAKKKAPVGDILIMMSAALYGYLHGFPEAMSIYRKQPGGVSNVIYRKSEIFFKYMRQLERIPELFGEEHRRKINEIVCSRYMSNSLEYLRHGQWANFAKCISGSFALSFSQTVKEWGKYMKHKLMKVFN